MAKKEKVLEVLDMIIEDTEKDAKAFEGKPFDGRTVAEYFGVIGAQVQALAKIVKQVVEEEVE